MGISRKTEDKFLSDVESAISAPRKNVKVRVTAMIDADVLDELRAQAEASGVGYQTLLNMKLRETTLGETVVDKNVIRTIVDKIKKLEKKVEALSKGA